MKRLNFWQACSNGDIAALSRLLKRNPALTRMNSPEAPFPGWTGLHEASRRGHLDAVRLLLQYGADPNARESGDNTTPLHWAAAHRRNSVVRALLDAGGDVQGEGDLHLLDVIGWATYFRDPGRPLGDKPQTAALLVKRGARHHVYSAMSLGDLDLLRAVLARDPAAMDRRMSRFEGSKTALHFALEIDRFDMLRLLVDSGAKLDLKDQNGLTPLETALLNGNSQAAALLMKAGARAPKRIRRSRRNTLAGAAGSVGRCNPMMSVPDVAGTLDWYVSLGFTETARYRDNGSVNFGVVRLGQSEILINCNGIRGKQTVSLWFSTDRVDEIYQRLKARQIEAALADGDGSIQFVEHINDTFYQARQFGIRDPNGYLLYFIQHKAGG